jgi:threonine dehydrogenase-like Zn-dependent dehydrogenase
MRALLKLDNGRLSIEEIPEPIVLEPDDVKIKVNYSTIGIEDMRMYREGDFFSKAGIAGYEMSGVIVALGEEAKRQGFYKGQRVSGTPAIFCGSCDFCKRGKENCCVAYKVSTGTICEYIVWKSRQLVPLNDRISDRLGCLLEPVATVLEAAERMHISIGDSVCIFGGDFLGLILVQLARMHGAKEITVVDPMQRRRELAQSLGADYVVDSTDDLHATRLMKISDFNGFDSIAITSGEADLFATAVGQLAKGGILTSMTYYELGRSISVDSLYFYSGNVTISSAFLYNKAKLELSAKLLPVLRANELVQAEFPFEKSIEAFSALKSGLYPRVAIKL